MGILNEASRFVGNIEKAVIQIWDERSSEEAEIEEDSTEVLGFAEYDMPDNPNKVPENKAHVKTYHVQFNPVDLAISASGKILSDVTDLTGELNRSMSVSPPNIDVTVPFVFDDTQNHDAFMWEAFSGTASAAKGAASAVKNKGKLHSVRTQVEGFLAAARNEYTQIASFTWGNLSYKGLLNTVELTYTMFNPKGEPIRAVGSIKLLCLDEKLAPYTGQMWQDKYNEMFIEDGISGNAGKAIQKVGNMLNLPF